ncbi:MULTISPECIES: DUF4395 domain-containing protein [unclassified Paenibacillus]|uniref:DUF4395 domain-containing protein n=1 Tax=unclassified Paenibacillus TaxID=185978 RepID=UPI00070B1CAE|nr:MULTISPECIES: DUF4395 domain-containing protein [unclassified Paenibacillus]KQX68034.1 hypothetical protein ASD40_26275 [Paenibacillus sp. Root444D2]KRE49482.1 hypothetical protein ASG85_24280 [Paenibacillus sp. Soil724D2]
MKEVPISYVKANQTGIVVFVLLAFAFQWTWLVALLWLIQLLGLVSGGKWNLFVAVSKGFLSRSGIETQAAELTRFNNTLAVLFLTLSLASFAIGWSMVGYIFTGFLLLAAGAGLLGYCIGCTIYYQYKQFILRRE